MQSHGNKTVDSTYTGTCLHVYKDSDHAECTTTIDECQRMLPDYHISSQISFWFFYICCEIHSFLHVVVCNFPTTNDTFVTKQVKCLNVT